MTTKKIKSFIFLSLLIFFYSNAFSQTEIAGGSILTSTWTAAGSPYNINGDITIPDANTLTLEPGVIINVTDTFFIRIEGTLIATGTLNDTILFTSDTTHWKGLEIESAATNDSTKIHYVQVENSYERGIQITNTDKVSFNHCQVNNNSAPAGGGLFISNSDITIRNSTFFNDSSTSTHGGGLYISSSNANIVNCLIRNNYSTEYGGGIMISNSTANLINNTIVKNNAKYGGGILLWYHTQANIYNSVLWGNMSTNGGHNLHIHTSHGFLSHTAIITGGASIHIPSSTGSTIQYSEGSFDASCIALSTMNDANFTDLAENDYSFNSSSPLVNAGAIYGLEEYLTSTDLLENERVKQGCIDIGALESDHFKWVMAAIPAPYGTITPLTRQYVGSEEHTYTIIPASYATVGTAEYNSTDIKAGLSSLTDTSTYTIANVTEHGELVVSFDLNDYKISTTIPGGNGTISPSEDTIVTYADTTEFTFIPADGYILTGASYDTVDIMNSLVQSDHKNYIYSLKNVKADGNIEAEFVRLYTLIASLCDNAQITPDTAYVLQDSAHVFNILPAEGYIVESATYNGNDILEDLVESGDTLVYSIPVVSEDGNLIVSCSTIEEGDPNKLLSSFAGKLEVFPNPVNDQLRIIADQESAFDIRLTDITGKTIYSETSLGQEHSIDVSTLSNGVYILVIQADSDSFTRQIIKK